MTDTVPRSPATGDPAPTPASTRAGPTAGRRRVGQSAAPQRAVSPVLERLFQLYPNMFGARFLPLKLGVFQELLALHPQQFTKDELKVALGQHARSSRYLESVAAGAKRHDLNGQPVEELAPEHIHHAILELFRRRQARSREDLRPRLRARLADAIEASGLARQDYAARVGTQDPVSAAALEEAFAELDERAARREALLRAYDASGRTEAEFAEMYGIDPALVRRVLERRKLGG